MITQVSKTNLASVVGNPTCRKAFAFAIFIKYHRNATVFRDFTYRELAREADIAPGTAKKYVSVLRKMGLVSITKHKNGHNYLVFKKLRKHKIKNKHNDKFHTPQFSDISIESLEFTNVKSIEKGLMALALYEKARKINDARHLIELGTNPDCDARLKEVKNAKRICRRNGWEQFTEHGISYRKVRRMLACGTNTVRQIICIGESLELFEAHRPPMVHVAYVGKGRGRDAVEYLQCDTPDKHLFATFSNVYYQPPMVYTPLR